MAKDPSPKADQLKAQREARYGHLQAKAPATDQGIAPWVNPDKPVKPKMGRPASEPEPARKLIPYAGKASKGEARSGPRTAAQKARTAEKKARQRVKHKRRAALPPEGEPKP